MTKRIIAVVMAFVIVAGVGTYGSEARYITTPVIAAAVGLHTEGIYEGFVYYDYFDHIEIVNCKQPFEGDVVIPDKINGLPVTAIGFKAFCICENMESIVIPEGVTSIGEDAFYLCKSLETITIPDSVKSFGKNAFSTTKWLENKQKEDPLVIVNNILIDGTACTGNVEIPDGVESINLFAFRACKDLESITIPDSVTSIGVGSFGECERLVSITIPDSVTSIGDSAFCKCTSLTSISIPESVTSINHSAFERCESLESIVIPDTVTSIGSWAFTSCTSLKSITIPDNVTNIGHAAFLGCTGLESITVPEGVTLIDLETFNLCESLRSITILNPKCEIYDEKSTISNWLDDFWGYYYNGIILGHKNSTAQAYAEKYGYKFKPLENEKTDGIYEGLTYKKYEDHVVITGCDKSAESVDIPAEIEGLPVTVIGELAFGVCQKLKSVTIPDTVTEIQGGAFNGCSNLEKITIPDSVKSIGIAAFELCESLTEITLPESVDSIGQLAFHCCKSLEKITILNPDCEIYDHAGTISNDFTDHPIFGYSFDGVICGYENSTAQSYAVSYGCKFLEIREKEGTYEGLTYKKYEDHVVITGCDKSAVSVDIPAEIEGLPVTVIGKSAFAICDEITSITLPDSVTTIGDGAFSLCSKLTEIELPDGVTTIGDDAFTLCSELTKIEIPDSVKSIGSNAFTLSGIVSVEIPDSVTELGNAAFFSCRNLTSVKLSGSITSIGTETFFGCDKLESITIPDSVKSIGMGAFQICTALTEITIPESVNRIEEYAFSDCASLASIIILNQECEIHNTMYTISNSHDENGGATYNGVIRGYPNSTARAYAGRWGYKFEWFTEAPEQPQFKPGDANCDGAVTIADATAILQYLGNSDKYPLSLQGKKNSDVTAPEGITVGDALDIQRFAVGLIEKFSD